MCMKVKIEFELENGDLNTLIKTFVLLFSKIDMTQIEPTPKIHIPKPEYTYEVVEPATSTDPITNATTDKIYYSDGSGMVKEIIDDKKKNEKIQS